MATATKRLLLEWRDYANTTNTSKTNTISNAVCWLGPVDENGEDLFLWAAVLRGPIGSPYEGGEFEIELQIPESYPLSPPKIHFKTPICHPNIHWKTGEICLDLLKSQWSPAWNLHSVCTAICVLMTTPEPDSPLNCDAANLLRCGDTRGYNSLVQMYTRLLAAPKPSSS